MELNWIELNSKIGKALSSEVWVAVDDSAKANHASKKQLWYVSRWFDELRKTLLYLDGILM